MSREIIRVGVVGCGNVFQGGDNAPAWNASSTGHLMGYPEIEGAAIVGFYDTNESRAASAMSKAKELYSARLNEAKKTRRTEEIEKCQVALNEMKVYTDVNRMIDDHIDMMDICAPYWVHLEYCLLALKNNIHVMTEKPMTRTWWEAEKIVAAAEESEALFQLNENYIIDERMTRTMEAIKKANIGDYQEIVFSINPPYKGGDRMPSAILKKIRGRHSDRPPLSGGIYMDLATHSVAQGWYLIGLEKKPLKVKSQFMRKLPFEGWVWSKWMDASDAWIEVLFEDQETRGWKTVYSINSDDPEKCGGMWWKIKGQHGFVHLVDWPELEHPVRSDLIIGKLSVEGKEEVVERLDAPSYKQSRTPSFRDETQYFVNCIREGKRSFLDEKWGAELMAVINAGYLSELEGRRAVTIDELKAFTRDIAAKYDEKDVADALMKVFLKPYE